MSNPVILGVLISPNPPLAGGPFFLKVTADDADLGNQESFTAEVRNILTGVVSKGLLFSEKEVLTYTVTPDPQSPPMTADPNDPSLFSGIAPSVAGPAKLAYDVIVNDAEGNNDSVQVVSQDIVYPPIEPPEEPPAGKVLKWEAVSDFDKNNNLSPFVGTANDSVDGSVDTYVTDAPPESGFTGKVCEIDYTSFGSKDTNRSFSYKPNGNPGNEQPIFGDVVETELLFTIPNPTAETINAGRKITYYQPHKNGPNHLVYNIPARNNPGPTGKIEFTLSTRTPPSPTHPKGQLQRASVMFEFGKPQRFRARCQINSAPGVFDGQIELWCADPANPSAERYTIFKNAEIYSELNFSWIDLRHGQQVNDNDAVPYSEKRWFKFARVALYR